MSTKTPPSANEEFTNFTSYLANHYRYKEMSLKEAIEGGEVTTEEERDEFLIRTEPLEEGFGDLPEEKQSIIELIASRDLQEAYSARMDDFAGQARELLGRKGELVRGVEPRIVEFVEEVAAFKTIGDKLRAQAKSEDEDEIEEEIQNMDVDSGDYLEGMDKLDEFIVKARDIVGHPEPIEVPGAAAPTR